MHLLILARNYPNSAVPLQGLWVERLVRQLSPHCTVSVVAPVLYCPPLPLGEYYTRFRRIPAQREVDGAHLYHPRFLVGPGQSLYRLEAQCYELGVRRLIAELHQRHPIDLIHAHFIYPDGVVAARLARQLGRPVVISEHAAWQPWLDQFPIIRRQALVAAKRSTMLVAGSRFLRDQIVTMTGQPEKVRIIPVGVDGELFCPRPDQPAYDPDQLLFVGFINQTKGVDLLLEAFRRVIERRPATRLTLIGGGFFKGKQRQEQSLRELAVRLGIDHLVTFLGPRPPDEVVAAMRRSALLVLPSRRETFGSVLVEALACGVPVVATRCGGPEDIVDERVGRLVATEDPVALADGLIDVLDRRSRFDSAWLRRYALERFSWPVVAQQMLTLYAELGVDTAHSA